MFTQLLNPKDQNFIDFLWLLDNYGMKEMFGSLGTAGLFRHVAGLR